MKTILAIVALLFVSLTPIAFEAPAQAQYYYKVWTCEARSPVAFGRGANYNLDAACDRALIECAARTPSYMTCYISRYW